MQLFRTCILVQYMLDIYSLFLLLLSFIHTHTLLNSSSLRLSPHPTPISEQKGDICANHGQVPLPNNSTFGRLSLTFASTGCNSRQHPCQKPIKKTPGRVIIVLFKHKQMFSMKDEPKLCLRSINRIYCDPFFGSCLRIEE
jgi:hypothetical protein